MMAIAGSGIAFAMCGHGVMVSDASDF